MFYMGLKNYLPEIGLVTLIAVGVVLNNYQKRKERIENAPYLEAKAELDTLYLKKKDSLKNDYNFKRDFIEKEHQSKLDSLTQIYFKDKEWKTKFLTK